MRPPYCAPSRGRTAAPRPPASAARGASSPVPVALAFFAGGYFDGPRDVALLAAGAVLAAAGRGRAGRRAAAALRRRAWRSPRGRPTRRWTALSATWAPVARPRRRRRRARAALRGRRWPPRRSPSAPRAAARALEPLAAAGTRVVVGYGLPAGCCRASSPSTRVSAAGRLDQPLTYWNAMGALAALGLVLCARIAGDRDRARRAARAPPPPPPCRWASALPDVLARRAGRARRRPVALVVLVAAPSGAAARRRDRASRRGRGRRARRAASPAVRALDGVARPRASARARSCSRSRSSLMARRGARRRAPRAPRPRARPAAAGALGRRRPRSPPCSSSRSSPRAAISRPPPATGATNQRFGSLGSNRYEYWQVALNTAADHPLAGVGAGGFAVEWLRAPRRSTSPSATRTRSSSRRSPSSASSASRCSRALLGGVALAARRGAPRDPALAAGPTAGARRLGASTPRSTGTGRCPRSRWSPWSWPGPCWRAAQPADRGRAAPRAAARSRQTRAREVDAGEQRRLGDRLPERPLAAPQREPQRQRRGRRASASGTTRAPTSAPSRTPRQQPPHVAPAHAPARSRPRRSARPTKPSSPHSASPRTASTTNAPRRPTASTAGGRGSPRAR